MWPFRNVNWKKTRGRADFLFYTAVVRHYVASVHERTVFVRVMGFGSGLCVSG
jgi:hypothetical protein